MSIDSDLEDRKNALPPDFSYSTIRSPNTEYLFSDTYHIYNVTFAALVWNIYRCARILTQDVITDWLSHNSLPDTSRDALQRRESHVLLVDLACQICASVPFILGESSTSMGPSQPCNATTAMSLLWPLYLAAMMDDLVPGMRAWIITRLELIGQKTGIKQAESLANVLRTKREITAWDKFDTMRPDEELGDW